MGLAV
jgi:hypothetical protein